MSLAPAFAMPQPVNLTNQAALPSYPTARAFDFAVGDFQVDGAGRVETEVGHAAWAVWCVKAALTERLAYLIYTPRYGCDHRLIRDAVSRAEAEAEARGAISRALRSDPRTREVRDFSFAGEGDALLVSFTVVPAVGSRQRITVRLEA